MRRRTAEEIASSWRSEVLNGGVNLKRIGRLVGGSLAVCISMAMAAAFLAGTGDFDRLREAVALGVVLCAVAMPLGLWLGSSYDRLKQWADHDPLTGVYTRRFLRDMYPRLVRQTDRKRKRFSVFLIDVDEFKSVNDTYGHAKGDEVLRRLAEELQTAAGLGEIVGRWGGDEFLLLCPYSDAPTLDKLQRGLEERVEQLAQQWNCKISLSIGTAVYPDEGRLLDELVQAADRSMYRDKSRIKEASTAHKLQA